MTEPPTKTLNGDQCLCRACGEYFTTTRNFDKHRRGVYPDRVCLVPSAVGLVQNARGFWHKPGNADLYRTIKPVGGDRRKEDVMPQSARLQSASQAGAA